MRVRDSQRSRVYKAERAAWRELGTGEYLDLPENRGYHKDTPLPETNAFIKEVWTLPQCEGFLLPTVRLSFKRHGAAAHQLSNEISLSVPMMKKWVLLHEIAHLIQPKEAFFKEAAHGPEFCDRYVGLVDCVSGRGAAATLVAEFNAHKVKHNSQHFLDDVLAEWGAA